MTLQIVSFDWNLARAFLATVEEGSLSGAARVLGQTQPTIGRQVAALENDLDIVLFERVGRSLVLTQGGIDILDHVRAMREAANQISLVASGRSQTIEGLVRITATDVISAFVLPPALKKLRETAPLLEIDVVAANGIRDLQRREADIAIRHVRPAQSELVSRLVHAGTAHFYASKTYLDEYGHPQSSKDLSNHIFVGFGDHNELINILATLDISLNKSNFRSGSENGIVAWEMARAGLGIIIMSDQVAASVANMEPILPDLPPITFPVWITTHRELHTSRRIRLVFDQLVEHFSKQVV